MDDKGWERSDFPIVCESCLGDNPYVRMIKEQHGNTCKICERPFTVFRWKPGSRARYKRTEVCQTCAKFKNVCQTCVLDLKYGLPVAVRDAVLGKADGLPDVPITQANREFFQNQIDQKMSQGMHALPHANEASTALMSQLARTTPYYKRNEAPICSFYVKGQCTRGAECPYRHTMPVTGPLAHQNIKDRYDGVNDPVADKILRQAEGFGKPEAAINLTTATLHVGGVDETISEADLRDMFFAYGEISDIRLVSKSNCAFVVYANRADAEAAFDALRNRLIIKGHKLKVSWAKPGLRGTGGEGSSSGASPFMPPPPGMGDVVYPSMRNQLGSSSDIPRPVHPPLPPPPPGVLVAPPPVPPSGPPRSGRP